MNTSTLVRRLAATLTSLLLTAAAATAQTAPPAWSSVYSFDKGINRTGVGTVDKSGNTYTVGFFQNTLAIGDTLLTSRGRTDGFLAKYAPNGKLAWVRQLGGEYDELATNIALDPADNVYVMGRLGSTIVLSPTLTVGPYGNAYSGYVVKFTPQGVAQWAQSGSGGDSGYTGICTDAVGHVFVTGYGYPGMAFGATGLRPTTIGPYIMRLSAATGEPAWLKSVFTYGPIYQSTRIDYPQISASPAGEVYLTNTFASSVIVNGLTIQPLDPGNSANTHPTNALLLKYSVAGSFAWIRVLSGANTNMNAVAVDQTDNVFITGSYFGESQFGPPGQGQSLPRSPVRSGSSYMARLTPAGSLAWVRSLNGVSTNTSNGPSNGSSTGHGIALDADGSPYLIGTVAGTIEAGGTMLTSTLDVRGYYSEDVLIAAFTTQGQLRWAQQAGGDAQDIAYEAGFDRSGHLHVLGTYQKTAQFGPYQVSTPLDQARFMATLGSAVLSTGTARPLALGLAPNPATGRVRLLGLPAGHPVSVFDQLGRLVRTGTLAPDASFSVQGLTSGLYVVRAVDAQKQAYAGRLVVE